MNRALMRGCYRKQAFLDYWYAKRIVERYPGTHVYFCESCFKFAGYGVWHIGHKTQ